MFVGLDFGTSNCAIAHRVDGQSRLIPLENGEAFMPSVLQAMDRSFIAQVANAAIEDDRARQQHAQKRAQQIRLAARKSEELGLMPHEHVWSMGHDALKTYFEDPESCWFVKSPKSFLGATGLHDLQVAFFEDLVTVMMHHIKQTAEQQLAETFQHAVIGRPVNFQGIGGEESNRQAAAILTEAAKRCGFKSVELFYEPLAAGLAYEASLTEDKTVLVLDIGGGTSDCSMILMGPSYRDSDDREQCFLGHTGTRVGGNDLDIALAFEQLMLPLGNKGMLKNGLPIPAQHYFNAACINDLRAQEEFFSQANADTLDRLVQDAQQPERVSLLRSLQTKRLNYRLVQQAEMNKIEFSEKATVQADLSFLAPELGHTFCGEAFEAAVERPVQKILSLLTETIAQAQVKPDIVYVTGGSGQSPLVQRAVKSVVGDLPMARGDAFGSVVAGLARWAEHIYRP